LHSCAALPKSSRSSNPSESPAFSVAKLATFSFSLCLVGRAPCVIIIGPAFLFGQQSFSGRNKLVANNNTLGPFRFVGVFIYLAGFLPLNRWLTVAYFLIWTRRTRAQLLEFFMPAAAVDGRGGIQ
jgi:hypothetical protein